MNTRVENYTAGVAVANALDTLLRKIQAWARREALKSQLRRERRQLAEMSDEMLRDLGVSHAEALVESAKTDIPAQRLTLESCA
ncbi:MAG: DUF1127 domain-containing protein [Gammaproteobacteria bacterium]|jgi:uncharacterized protein YjiS (DUF1127 family)